MRIRVRSVYDIHFGRSVFSPPLRSVPRNSTGWVTSCNRISLPILPRLVQATFLHFGFVLGDAMKSPSFLIMVITAAIFTGLSMAQLKYAPAGGETARNALSKADADSMQQQIVLKEREELDSLKSGNVEVFANLLADDAVFVDAEGPAIKAEIVKNVTGFRLLEYSMLDVRFVPISAESGLISYRIVEKGVSHGKEFAAQVYVSAAWTQRKNQWVCVFSQETAAKPPKDK
jgi:hypothetical protein